MTDTRINMHQKRNFAIYMAEKANAAKVKEANESLNDLVIEMERCMFTASQRKSLQSVLKMRISEDDPLAYTYIRFTLWLPMGERSSNYGDLHKTLGSKAAEAWGRMKLTGFNGSVAYDITYRPDKCRKKPSKKLQQATKEFMKAVSILRKTGPDIVKSHSFLEALKPIRTLKKLKSEWPEIYDTFVKYCSIDDQKKYLPSVAGSFNIKQATAAALLQINQDNSEKKAA